MNIYIYGNSSFVKEINTILSKSKIKARLEGIGSITNVKAIAALKEAILTNPKDIFLIDHSKVIIDNIFTKYLKILKPSNGIEKKFLEDNGIGDLSIDSISDISNHILKRLEAIEQENGTCSIVSEYNTNKTTTNENIEVPQVTQMHKKPIEETQVGTVMAELTQLDEISEADILSALSGIDGLDISSSGDTIKITSANSETSSTQNSSNHTIEVDSSNMNDVASLLEQLMNNKTLEISIKVKS